jgi:hypothetical protein
MTMPTGAQWAAFLPLDPPVDADDDQKDERFPNLSQLVRQLAMVFQTLPDSLNDRRAQVNFIKQELDKIVVEEN